jgi:hypothetical protein
MTRNITLNAGLRWADVKDDYVLRYEEYLIGRMRRAETGWEWYINIPMEMPAWTRGSAGSLDECRRLFAAAWGRLLNETNPERLERAWELERAVAARQKLMDTANKAAV